MVVGFGLAGVMAAEALLQVSPERSTFGRISLILVGCPLRRLMRLFPKRLPAESEMADNYERCLEVWANLWLDRDVGAQALVGNGQIIQGSAGDGFHRDSLTSSAIWKCLWRIVDAIETGAVAALRKNWPLDDALSEEEHSALAQIEATLSTSGTEHGRGLYVDLAMLGLLWLEKVPYVFIALTLAGIVGNVLFLVGLSGVVTRPAVSPRAKLRALRVAIRPLYVSRLPFFMCTAFAGPALMWFFLWRWPYVVVGFGVFLAASVAWAMLARDLTAPPFAPSVGAPDSKA